MTFQKGNLLWKKANHKGHTPWNKGKHWNKPWGRQIQKGEHLSNKTEFKEGQKPWNKGIKGYKPWMDLSGLHNTGYKKEINPNWKGDQAGYGAKHNEIRRDKGKAKQCVICGENKKRIHWANIDHKYRRNPSDYIELCAKHHRLYDMGKLEIDFNYYNMLRKDRV